MIWGLVKIFDTIPKSILFGHLRFEFKTNHLSCVVHVYRNTVKLVISTVSPYYQKECEVVFLVPIVRMYVYQYVHRDRALMEITVLDLNHK